MLTDQTVIVTGGTTGIGKTIALAFASAGANIVLNYLFDDADAAVAEIEAKGVKCIAVKGDVSNFEDAGALMAKAKEVFGHIDVLVNNAGITKDSLLMRMSEKDFDAVINVNLKGAFNTIRQVSNIMFKQKSGTIINMSSVVGVMGNVGQVNYSASKAGLLGLTKSAARELASRGITCNAIAPGFVDSAMTDVLPDKVKEQMLNAIPLKRFGSAQEIADTALFLAQSKYITGQVIHVNGGMYM